MNKITGYQALGSTESIKFGRDVAETLMNSQNSLDKLSEDFNNNSASTLTTTRKLGDQIAALQSVVDDLAANAARLSDLEKLTLDVSANAGGATGFAVGTSYSTVVNSGVVVPTGYTRASVTVNAFAAVASQDGPGSGDQLFFQVQCAGNTSPELKEIIEVGGVMAGLGGSISVNLTGLTGGTVISANANVHLLTGSGSGAFQAYNSATLSMQAIFRK